MELFNENEINSIIKQAGLTNPIKWQIVEFPDKVIGNLGDYVMLIIQAEKHEVKTELKLFVKCMPRFDQWKAEYIKDLNFFCKEFIMLSKLFEEFQKGEGSEAWRPRLLYIRHDLFVFDDVNHLGYKMPHHQDTMTYPILEATVKTLARFHAQSYIYEERKSKELGKAYRIWDEYSEYLQEPEKTQKWRNTGKNAVIDFLKVFSKYKSKPDFSMKVEDVIPLLFERALALTKPSIEYRNVVIHRDLWTNNIFIKEEDKCEPHALIIDFQTVLYACPMLDLSSLIYFNTSKSCRHKYTGTLINVYYDQLSMILREVGLNIDDIFQKEDILKAYKESLIFGITQAALIVPIVSMNSKKRKEIFYDPVKRVKANLVSRSQEFIDIAKEDYTYYNRILDLFDEIVEIFIYPKATTQLP